MYTLVLLKPQGNGVKLDFVPLLLPQLGGLTAIVQ